MNAICHSREACARESGQRESIMQIPFWFPAFAGMTIQIGQFKKLT